MPLKIITMRVEVHISLAAGRRIDGKNKSEKNAMKSV